MCAWTCVHAQEIGAYALAGLAVMVLLSATTGMLMGRIQVLTHARTHARTHAMLVSRPLRPDLVPVGVESMLRWGRGEEEGGQEWAYTSRSESLESPLYCYVSSCGGP